MQYEIDVTTGNGFYPHYGQIVVIVKGANGESHSASLGHTMLQPNWAYQSRLQIPIPSPNIQSISVQYVSQGNQVAIQPIPSVYQQPIGRSFVPPPIHSMYTTAQVSPTFSISSLKITPIYLQEPYRSQMVKRYAGNPNVQITSHQIVPLHCW